MKILGSPASSSYYDAESREMVHRTDEVIEMEVKDGVASLPKPPQALGYRPLGTPGVILEDQLPLRPDLVSAKYEAAGRLTYLTTGVISCRK